MFWTAPELLENDNGTQKGDIYSLGIIINEIVTREFPYEYVDKSAKQIIDEVSMMKEDPFRLTTDWVKCDDVCKLI